MVKSTFILCLAIACSGVGNIMLRKGMVVIGPLESYQLIPLFHFFVDAVTNPWIILGILLEIADFFLWLAVLSWADVSWALPMRAIEYIFVALLAIFLLKESFDWTRWAGVFFIALGLLFMMRSWNHESQEDKLRVSTNKSRDNFLP